MKKFLIVLVSCIFSLSLFAAPKGWIQDFEDAQKQAEQQKKNMLVFFTGSDWCGLCRALENNILTKKEFQNPVSREYVFVYIDSPRNKSLIPPKARTENPKLFKKYAIAGTPTILLMASDGSVFGRSGYKNVSAKEYANGIISQTKASIIPKLRISIKKLPKGEARSRAIDAVLSKLGSDIQQANMDLVKEICETDPNGTLGMRNKYFEVVELSPIFEEISSISTEIFAANISAKGKSQGEKNKIVSAARDKNRSRLLELKAKLIALNKTAPATTKKTIANTLAGVNSMLGE